MKKVKIVFLEAIFEWLKKKLRWDGKEKAAYILCHSSSYRNRLKFIPFKIFVPEEKDYIQRSTGYYILDKPFINRVLNEAIETQTDFLQCHIHPNDPAKFSPIDEKEELNFMRHIADKIEGIYHGSLVFGNSLDTLDGWFYDREEDKTIAIEKITVVGKNNFLVFVPPLSCLKERKLAPQLDRTIEAFGEKAVRMLGTLDIGVVGASALGAPFLEFIVRDRMNSLLLCDPDIIENTNQNRLPFVTLSDNGRYKVEFYADYINQINPEMEISTFQETFYNEDVQKAFSQPDMFFGCVDSGSRLSINRRALANCIPYFDHGAGIEIKNGRPNFVGGQIYSTIPGREVCLNCSGVFNNLKQEYLSPEEREREIKQGYLKDVKDGINPLVHFLDYTIAGIGYHQMLKYLWGTEDEEIFSVHYNGVKNRLIQSKCDKVGCINCQSDGFLGKGDKVPALVPRKKVDNNFLGKLAKSLKRT